MNSFLRAGLRNPSCVAGFSLLLAMVGLNLLAPVIFPYSAWDMRGAPLMPPGSEGFLLGTDAVGRDIAAGMAYGASVSILIALASTLAAVLLGIGVGAASGYVGGWIDDVLMRVTEFFQTIPTFILAVVIVAITSPSIGSIVFAIALVSWPPVARVVRAEFRTLKQREFVQAAEVLGRSQVSIAIREILPNALSPILVLASLMVGIAVLLESSLSFLGLGDPNLISWGSMIGAGRSMIRVAWWIAVFPGVAIFLVVLAFSLLSDGLDQVLNPHSRGRR